MAERQEKSETSPLQAVRDFLIREVDQRLPEDMANMLRWHFKGMPGKANSLKCRLCASKFVDIGFPGRVFNLLQHMASEHVQDMRDWQNFGDDPMLEMVSQCKIQIMHFLTFIRVTCFQMSMLC